MDNNNNLDKRFEEYLDKYIKKEKINHAYILETNYDDRQYLVKILINKILKTYGNSSYDELLINNDLIIIDDNINIKTDEIENLKERFKTKSINYNKRIYVILNSEKLNISASNKLLKFLEEPEDDILAILVTENRNNLLKTIVSRCQILRFFITNDDISNKYDDEYIQSLFEFIMNVEENNEKAIAFQNRYDVKKLSDRTYLQSFLNNLLLVYDDVIQYIISKNTEHFYMYEDLIEKISNGNDINSVKNKIYAINFAINKLKYNPNIKLLIDKLIIMMSGVDVK